MRWAGRQFGDQLLREWVNGSVVRISPPLGVRAKLSKAGSMSAGARTGTTIGLHAQRRCSGFDRAHEKFGLRRGIGVEHDRYAREVWRNLLEQIEPLPPTENSVPLKP